MHPQSPVRTSVASAEQNIDAVFALNEVAFQHVLHRRAIAFRCRATELADALQRFRDRKQQIETGSAEPLIRMPPVAAGWLIESIAA